MNNYPHGEIKPLTRHRTRLVWQTAQLGGDLSDEDARLVNAMREHPEYADLWGHLDELSDEQIERDGTNPITHVIIHATIENQIANGDPKETAQTVEALTQQGSSQHEAIHAVGAVMADEIFHVLKDKRPFDEAGFVRKLKRLAKPGAARPRRRAKGRYR
jgi:hypothetical protein